MIPLTTCNIPTQFFPDDHKFVRAQLSFYSALFLKRADYSHGFSSVFLVGAFLVKRARLLQWLVFFGQTTDLIVYVPLFTETTKAKSSRCKLSAKGPAFIFYFFKRNLQNRTKGRLKGPLSIFFGTVTFFENFLLSKKSPPSTFLIFCNKMYFNKSQRVPFSALCGIFLKKYEVFFKIFFS